MDNTSKSETQAGPTTGDVLPVPVIPTCEQMAAAAVQSLSGLPADRSGAVHWDHVQRVLYVPTV